MGAAGREPRREVRAARGAGATGAAGRAGKRDCGERGAGTLPSHLTLPSRSLSRPTPPLHTMAGKKAVAKAGAPSKKKAKVCVVGGGRALGGGRHHHAAAHALLPPLPGPHPVQLGRHVV